MSALELLAQAPPPPPELIEAQKAMEERMIADLPFLAPIGLLVLAAVGGVALALVLPASRQRLAAWYVGGLHLLVGLAAAVVWLEGGFRVTMEGTFIVDGLFLCGAGIIGITGAISVAMLRSQIADTDREGDMYAVLAAASLGSLVLAGAGDAAMLALALGLASICSYVMVGYQRRAERANEASLKFYIYGTVASAAMVYGLTFWYGLAGSTTFAEMGDALAGAPAAIVVLSGVLVIAGLGFKASVVPFHFWAPDSYEGAPTSIAGYLSVVPKIGAVVALVRILPAVFPDSLLGWPDAIAVIAAATMMFGALAMIPQQNSVRLLAYSSISQSGFMLIGVAAAASGALGVESLLYFLAAYAVANLGAFAVVAVLERETGSVGVAAMAGLGRRRPWMAAALLLCLLSLIGIPPLAGFVGKLELFTAALEADMLWLAIVGIIATVVSLYPYLRLFAPAILDDTVVPHQARRPSGAAAASVAATLLVVAAGLGAEGLLAVANQAIP